MFQKHQILESLNELDQSQTEEVLAYIRTMISQSRQRTHHEGFSKKQAMMQIRQALHRTRNVRSL